MILSSVHLDLIKAEWLSLQQSLFYTSWLMLHLPMIEFSNIIQHTLSFTSACSFQQCQQVTAMQQHCDIQPLLAADLACPSTFDLWQLRMLQPFVRSVFLWFLDQRWDFRWSELCWGNFTYCGKVRKILKGFLEPCSEEQKVLFPILQVWFLLDDTFQVGIPFLRTIQILWLIFEVNSYKKSHELFLNLSCGYYIEILLKANHFIAFLVVFTGDFDTSIFEEHLLFFLCFFFDVFHLAKSEKINILNARHKLCLFVVVFVYYSWRFLSFSHIWSEEKSIQSRAHFFEQNNHLCFLWSHSWLWSSALMFIQQYLQQYMNSFSHSAQWYECTLEIVIASQRDSWNFGSLMQLLHRCFDIFFKIKDYFLRSFNNLTIFLCKFEVCVFLKSCELQSKLFSECFQIKCAFVVIALSARWKEIVRVVLMSQSQMFQEFWNFESISNIHFKICFWDYVFNLHFFDCDFTSAICTSSFKLWMNLWSVKFYCFHMRNNYSIQPYCWLQQDGCVQWLFLCCLSLLRSCCSLLDSCCLSFLLSILLLERFRDFCSVFSRKWNSFCCFLCRFQPVWNFSWVIKQFFFCDSSHCFLLKFLSFFADMIINWLLKLFHWLTEQIKNCWSCVLECKNECTEHQSFTSNHESFLKWESWKLIDMQIR